jgi:hypothetical protein
MPQNTTPLDKALAEQIEGLLRVQRKAAVDLARIAAQIRNEHFDSSTNRYDAQFEAFWKNFSMERKFGSRANFTKYAKAGDAIGLVAAQFEKYESKLPTTLDPLYEFSQLNIEEIELCLEDTYTRTEVTPDREKWKKGKNPKPLITPSTTASAIRSWRKNWREPKQPITDKRRLPLAELKLHGSFFDFKDGKPVGLVSIEAFDEIIRVLHGLREQLGEDIIRFDINEEKLRTGYGKRELASLEKKKKADETAAVVAKKKPPAKKKASVKRLKSA